jgi:hypothetical protein
MAQSDAPGGPYEVKNSGSIARAFLRLQRQATKQGRGKELLAAARQIYERLRKDPNELGEPLYRLPLLRLRVRCVAVRPLYVDFGVYEDRPIVFIKAVKLFEQKPQKPS